MTTRPSFNHASQNAFPGKNPFQAAPMPVPLEGWNLRAPDIFRERPLADHLGRNAGWLQARPRTSNQIEDALFPSYSLGGMQREEVRAQLNRALWDAGYTPNCEDENPTWTWTEGN
jgi:hypothetical protein